MLYLKQYTKIIQIAILQTYLS